MTSFEIAQSHFQESTGFIPSEVAELKTGGNNRSFTCAFKKNKYVVKYYYKENNADHSRLLTEWNFLLFLKSINERQVPLPILKNEKKGFLIYSYLTGKKISGKPSVLFIDKSADFITRINSEKAVALSKNISLASEAAFTIEKFISLTEKKIDLLCDVPSEEAPQVFELIKTVIDTFNMLKLKSPDIFQFHDEQGELRCLSPSDFGTHNSLVGSNQNYQYLDFEYAGWDDPTKLILDLYLNPQSEIQKYEVNRFLMHLILPKISNRILLQRCEILYPFAVLRWICIVLNIFQRPRQARIIFANPDLEIDLLKKQQYEKAELLLSKLNSNPFTR